MYKRGLSSVVSNVLIILLVITSVFIIAAFMIPFFNNSRDNTEIYSRSPVIISQLKVTVIEYNPYYNLTLSVRRISGNEVITGLYTVLTDESGKNLIFDENGSIEEFESRNIFFNYTSVLGHLTTIEVAPKFLISTGREVVSSSTQKFSKIRTGGGWSQNNFANPNPGVYSDCPESCTFCENNNQSCIVLTGTCVDLFNGASPLQGSSCLKGNYNPLYDVNKGNKSGGITVQDLSTIKSVKRNNFTWCNDRLNDNCDPCTPVGNVCPTWT
jgi:hypothetical protein